VARGPTTELSVARDPNAPDPWENQPSLFSQLLTQGWQGVAGGATTQGITNLFGIAAADVPLTPGTTSRRPEIEAYFAMPPEQRLAFKVELSKDPSATAQSIMGILGDIDDGTLRSPEDLDTYNVIPPEPVATPMRQRPAFKRAKELEAWKQRNLPVPQDQGTGLDIYRSLMEGLGTMAASVGTAVTAGPEAAAVSALLSGLGETTQEVYSDENIAAAQGFQRGDQGVQPGLSAPRPTRWPACPARGPRPRWSAG
jgi:hypothetical protein